MSKLSKLIRNPRLFFIDAFNKKSGAKNKLKKHKPRRSILDVSKLASVSNQCFVFRKGSNPYLDIIDDLDLKVILIDEQSGRKNQHACKGG